MEPLGLEWNDYQRTSTYTDAEREIKAGFVAKALEGKGARLVFDLGGNDGTYSRVAAGHADYVVCADGDDLVLDSLYRSLRQEGNHQILPAYLDLSDPSPSLGWRGRERAGFFDRARPDAVLALALLHHLAITGNVPLAELVDWLHALGGRLVVEFVDPADPMADRLLANKPPGMHGDYRREVFERLLEARFDIADREEYPSGTPHPLPRHPAPLAHPRGTIPPRGCSSVGQSRRLIIARSQVRGLPAPTHHRRLQACGDCFACSAVIPWSFFWHRKGMTSRGSNCDPQAPATASRSRSTPAASRSPATSGTSASKSPARPRPPCARPSRSRLGCLRRSAPAATRAPSRAPWPNCWNAGWSGGPPCARSPHACLQLPGRHGPPRLPRLLRGRGHRASVPGPRAAVDLGRPAQRVLEHNWELDFYGPRGLAQGPDGGLASHRS